MGSPLDTSDDDRDKAFAETQTILRVYPSVRLVMAISAPDVPGVAEAVRQARRGGDVRVIGLSLPNINKPYVHDGTVQTVVLWNTADLGYLAVTVAVSLAADRLTLPVSSFDTAGGGSCGFAARRCCWGRRCSSPRATSIASIFDLGAGLTAADLATLESKAS
jgi:hypothetical protein